ncbi:MAG: hypothetical protein U0230_14100 [Polyangiales bacterium]
MAIDVLDEKLHVPGPGRAWQESYYFNWSDPAHDVFGLTRIGLRPNEGRADALVLTIRNGRPEFLYPGVGLRLGAFRSLDPSRGIAMGRLRFVMEEPLRRWRLVLEGRDSMDLVFEACNEPFDYHAVGGDAAEFGSPMAAHHFEQFGRVRGTTRFHGKTISIDGFGERDKSWGERDWARIEGWNWLTAQFGPDFAFNVLDVFDRGRRHLGGFVYRDGANHAVKDYTVDFTWGVREHAPRTARIRIDDVDGGHLEVDARADGRFPLYRKRTWIEEAKAEFRTELGGTARVGHGVLEHVFRPDLRTTLRQAGDLFPGLARAFRP